MYAYYPLEMKQDAVTGYCRGQCKFYAKGTCLKGEACDFAHGLMMAPRTTKVCMHYQRGTCAYGSRCKFVHAKSSWVESSATSSSSRAQVCIPATAVGMDQNSSVSTVISDPIKADVPPVKPDTHAESSSESGGNDRKICLLAADGNCPHGETCEDIHGDLCSTCGKYCLHPSKPEDREKHAKECANKQLLELSQEIECSVCLERVLSKPIAAERKFGLLAECDHAFCISCIKKWRSSSNSLEMIDNSAARACPVCRKLSYYVIPSPVWYSSKEEKQEVIVKYKAKLKSIDCRYFNFGSGCCRHGSNCFYKHEVKPGSSRRNRPANARYKRNNRQYMRRWDGDPLGFGEFVDVSDLDMMLEMFEDLFLPDEEAMGEDEEEDAMDFFKKLHELELKCSLDYDEEDLLEPWQREFLYAQLGYDTDEYMYHMMGSMGYETDDNEFSF